MRHERLRKRLMMLKIGGFTLALILILAGVLWSTRLLEGLTGWERGVNAVGLFVVFGVIAFVAMLAVEVLVGAINALLQVSNDTERLTELLAKGLGAEDTQRILRRIESATLLPDEDRRRKGRETSVQSLVDEISAEEREQHWNRVYPLVAELIERFPDSDAALRYRVQLDELRHRAVDQDLKAARKEAEQLGSQGNWALALALAERLERRYPGTAAVDDLRQELARRRETAEEEELGALVARVEGHIEEGNWTQAQMTAERLARRFPASQRVVGLLERIRALADEDLQTKKTQLESAIKDLIQERRWQEAVERTRLYLELYPESPGASGLRDRLPRLERNAQADDRDELLRAVKQAMNSRRYEEAYDRASEFLSRYPESKESEVIRRDLDQLKERARKAASAETRSEDESEQEPDAG